MPKKYVVFGTSYAPIHCVVEAKSEKEAMKKAENVMGSEIEFGGDAEDEWEEARPASEVWGEKGD
ncbi:MAG: hypothetical protein CL455_06870 [Acidimicrobiaceae bacterium]|nr:hypothetical protein [Acidimicrobiaceae bacterium]|tara:strand:+ start:664 stop:858 length:195 start_codon:yes stop_codon:yes gene_type:complete